MAYLEAHQLDIDTSDLSNGTLSKAFKFAKTRLKVSMSRHIKGHALQINVTS